MGRPVDPPLSGTVPDVLVLGVADVVAVINDFAARLRSHRDALNAINVFPVADNDTGTNMVRTLEVIAASLGGEPDMSSAVGCIEEAALSGRGNSGLIIGQFLVGFSSAVREGRLDVAAGIVAAAALARDAVASPVEGTILTVADSMADAVLDLPTITARQLAAHAHAAVAATTGQLAVLAERGVVDAGAAGLALFFDALASVERGEDDWRLIMCNVGLEPSPAERVGPEASDPAAYEIQFRVPRTIVDAEELQTILVSLGTDVVVASSADLLSAHVHVVDPHMATNAISARLESRPSAQAISYDVEAIVVRGER